MEEAALGLGLEGWVNFRQVQIIDKGLESVSVFG